MKTTAAILRNNRGAVVISTLIIISMMIVVMVGIASVQILTISKDSNRANQALKYLSVMEEMGQFAARMRQSGREYNISATACPAAAPNALSIGSSLHICSPKTTITATCLSRTDAGITENFCFESITAIDAGNSNLAIAIVDPADISANPAAAATEPLTPSTTLNANYHSEEPWFPQATTTVWPASNLNEVRTATCEWGTQFWLGCQRCGRAGVTCLEMKICPPHLGTGCSNPYVQRIAVY